MNVPTNSVFTTKVSITLLTGVLRPIKAARGTRSLDSGSETEESDSMESEIKEESVDKSLGQRRPCYPGITNLEVISIITELMNFQYR